MSIKLEFLFSNLLKKIFLWFIKSDGIFHQKIAEFNIVLDIFLDFIK